MAALIAASWDPCSDIDRGWSLVEGAGGAVSHRGSREAGLSGAGPGAGYFLLVKDSSAHNTFAALPVTEWYNFRQVARCASRLIHLSWLVARYI